MEGEFSTSGFSDALVILGAAGIVIPAFARIRISPIIGFILIGMLVGPHGLGALTPAHSWLHYVTISNPHAIEPFAELGIVLLLFSIGLELSFGRLWGMRGLVFGAGAAELLGSAAILAGGLYVVGESPAGAIGLGLALALSSTAIVIPLVGTHSPVGRSALAMLLFEDLALVPIVFLLGAMAPQAAGAGVGLGIFLITVGMSVDFRVVLAGWQSLLLALFAVLLVKAAVTALLLRLGGTRMAVAAETGVLMASPSETTLIVLGSAAAAQLISRDTAAFWQIVTAMGLTVTPLLANLGRAAGRRFAGQERASRVDAWLEEAKLGQAQ